MTRLGVDWSIAEDVRSEWQTLDEPILQLTIEHAFRRNLPEAFVEGLHQASARGDLVGHAVMGAPYTAPRDALHQAWMTRARRVVQQFPMRWLTDHVGLSRAGGWSAAPLPVPYCRGLVAHVQEHLRWLSGELELPVGLENLALAASLDDVYAQPVLLDEVLEPVDGVLLLDLHNLWCQAINFAIDPIDLLDRHPLHRVRQLHVAGGSWVTHAGGRLRRDTHDGPVPTEVFDLLDAALDRCPNIEVVVLERLGGTIRTSLDPDLRELKHRLSRPRTPRLPAPVQHRPIDHGSFDLQIPWMEALRDEDPHRLRALLPGWWTDDRTLDAAVELTRTWGRPLPRT